MRMRFGLVTLGSVLLASIAVAQQPAVTFSGQPVAPDRAAVYQAFVAGYMADPDGPKTLNVAMVTSAFAPDEGDIKGCMSKFPQGKPLTEVHSLKGVFGSNVILVDPKAHQLQDPGDAIRKGTSVDEAVRKGFDSALLTISEILFDESHTHAALYYSFQCGSLCGNGGTLIFELNKGKWVRSKLSCGTWIS